MRRSAPWCSCSSSGSCAADRAGAGEAAGAGAGRPQASTVPEYPLELLAKPWRDVLAREPIGDIGGEEADFRAAVEARALELEAKERLLLRQTDHGVGELNFVAGAARLVRPDGEDLRLQDVAARDDEIGRRLLAPRLLHHLGDLERLADRLAYAHHAVHVDALARHFLDCDHVGGAAAVRTIDVHHLREAAAAVLYQHVGQQ